MKSRNREHCWCEQSSFDYKNKENILIGRTGKENPFTIKKIEVFEMEEFTDSIDSIETSKTIGAPTEETEKEK